MQHATCTDGPSLPTERPDAMTSGCQQNLMRITDRRDEQPTSVTLLMKNVANPRKPCMTKPAKIHLISEMPDPAAYLASARTRWAAMKEKRAWAMLIGLECQT